MIFPIVSGGSGDLTLKVIASTTRPTGTENLIWVNTSTAMTSWIVSSETPSSPAANMVWICTAWQRDGSVNVLKQNGLYIRPTGAFQYIDSAWTEKETQIYTGGAWVDISYTYHPIIDGYCMSQYKNSGTPMITPTGYWTDGSGLYIASNQTTDYKSWCFTKAIWIDGSKTTMTIKATQTSNGDRSRYVGVKTTTNAVTSSSDFAASVKITSNGTHTLSLTAIDAGYYYIAGWVQGYSDPSTGSIYGCSLTVTDIQIS